MYPESNRPLEGCNSFFIDRGDIVAFQCDSILTLNLHPDC